MFKLLFDVHQCSPVFFLLNIVYFSVCLTSNKLYWIEEQQEVFKEVLKMSQVEPFCQLLPVEKPR